MTDFFSGVRGCNSIWAWTRARAFIRGEGGGGVYYSQIETKRGINRRLSKEGAKGDPPSGPKGIAGIIPFTTSPCYFMIRGKGANIIQCHVRIFITGIRSPYFVIICNEIRENNFPYDPENDFFLPTERDTSPCSWLAVASQPGGGEFGLGRPTKVFCPKRSLLSGKEAGGGGYLGGKIHDRKLETNGRSCGVVHLSGRRRGDHMLENNDCERKKTRSGVG